MRGTKFKIRDSASILLTVIFIGAFAVVCMSLLTTEYARPITVAILIVCITVLLKSQNESWSHFGLEWTSQLSKQLFQVMLIIAFVFVVVLNLFLIIGNEPPAHSHFDGLEGNLPAILKWLTIGWVVGGFFEEMIFRGFLLNYFERSYYGFHADTNLAVVSQALLFGSFHYHSGGINAGLTMFLFGVLSGTLYVRYQRNLWSAIVARGVLESIAIWKPLIQG